MTISYEEALSAALSAADDVGRLPFSNVPLAEALGRVAAADVAASEPLPAFANSAMDGYAVAAAKTRPAERRQPLDLRLLGSLAAGDAPPAAPAKEGAWEIMTGAPLPAGFDAVVRVEDAERVDGGAAVRLFSPAAAGDFVRPAGCDFTPGQSVCAAGELIDEPRLMALAALGAAKVSVRRKPRVAVLSTGKELVSVSAKPGPGQIRNSSAAYLMAALEKLGAEPRSLGVVADDPAEFRRKLDAAAGEGTDVVLTTGAVSVGRHDFVASAVADAGAAEIFHGVTMRPGRPILCARLGQKTLFFGLPGNPVSTAVGLRFFVAPVLRRLLGRPDERPLRAALAAAVEKPKGLLCFLKAVLSFKDSTLTAEAARAQGSHQISPLLECNGWLRLPEDVERLPAGREVDAYPALPGALVLSR